MNIKAINKRVNLSVYVFLVISLLWLFLTVLSLISIVKDINKLSTIFLVMIVLDFYFISSTIRGFKIINSVGIKLDNNILTIKQYEHIDKSCISLFFLYPFMGRMSKMTFPTTVEFNLKDIKKYGFIVDLNESFKYKTKFNIGFISKHNDKYLIILNQFNEEEIIELMKEIKKITKIEPTGSLKNIINK